MAVVQKMATFSSRQSWWRIGCFAMFAATGVVQGLQTPNIQFPKFSFPNFALPSLPAQNSRPPIGNKVLEDELLAAIAEQGRLNNSERIKDLVEQLEVTPSIKRPAVAPQVMGRWRLLHTNNAETSSPIQRKAVDATKYQIYQDIELKGTTNTDDDDDVLIVSQVVKFGDTSELRVDALASTAQYPLEELTARKSSGKLLGLNLLGVSLVGEEAQPDPSRPDSRIDFVFDEGIFDFNGLKIPYPVPFRLPIFRDIVKGWIDITYLSDRVRISRGNKGTTFVLLKEEDESMQ
uniref:Plastid lipid-associated protein/fibrillin conserved domain-containing protein n=1 Tax=Attheya septentrionalis TaxID=420275 RepID=A0A7S2XTA1_9STRA|mmetsp:Transcript_6601/g.11855  ORF Transcript_6601/g.11855 Transcript_6601/m.11855 type:complete len:291 (+) Transcript_6601:117-989(+)